MRIAGPVTFSGALAPTGDALLGFGAGTLGVIAGESLTGAAIAVSQIDSV
ncbi:hypothetical protein OHA72_46105 [Dactylosporangium sp. NBC_01737]|nr:hypothetical protein OHA72_46105 [Dactylosporangium sp. NBC_01737]